MTRKVVDAKQDEKGNITHVKIEGNERFTPVETAIPMAERGELKNVHVVHRKGGNDYLRSNPDSRTKNNLDEMAKD